MVKHQGIDTNEYKLKVIEKNCTCILIIKENKIWRKEEKKVNNGS